MRTRAARRVIGCCVAAALVVVACKANNISSNNITSTAGSDVVGPEGGVVSGPDGTQVRIPAGALTQKTTITISISPPNDYPPLAGTYTDETKVYAFEPHGVKFNTTVVIDIPLPIVDAASNLVLMHADPNGQWTEVSSAMFTLDTAEVAATSFSFYTVASRASPPDSGPTCSGRGPDNSAPTGSLTGASGMVAGSPAVDLSQLLDGYAISDSSSFTINGEAGTRYVLTLIFTPYPHACGYYANDVEKIGASGAGLSIQSDAPFTTQSYCASDVSAFTYGLPAGIEAGACPPGGDDGGAGGALNCSGVPTAFTITAIDAQHVVGSFNTTTGSESPISGSFDVPFCQKRSLSALRCCIP